MIVLLLTAGQILKVYPAIVEPMPSIGTYKSSVNKQKECFRTTIPQAVAKALAVSHKDVLSWDIQIDDKGKVSITIEKTAFR